MRLQCSFYITVILLKSCIASLYEWLSCYVCEYTPLTGKVHDCSCEFNEVDEAVRFFQPILHNITQTTFFRYFLADMESPCPFWKENAMCMMEGCSVCTCAEEEVPKAWLAEKKRNGDDKRKAVEITSMIEPGYGWISPPNSVYGDSFAKGLDDTLGRLDFSNSNDWIHSKDGETYVNLLQNPERYTGYSGESAARVWRAIQQENCFGGEDDTCLEKRVFYRLMSGLQSSISTHIAKSFYYPPPVDKWGTNLPLFLTAVGNHQDRLTNLYFTFLFLVRAAEKAKNLLIIYPIDSGNATDDALAHKLLLDLLHSTYTTHGDHNSLRIQHATSTERAEIEGPRLNQSNRGLMETRQGFDETVLFQVLYNCKHL